MEEGSAARTPFCKGGGSELSLLLGVAPVSAAKATRPHSSKGHEEWREKQCLEGPSLSCGAGGGWPRWKDIAQETFSLQGGVENG